MLSRKRIVHLKVDPPDYGVLQREAARRGYSDVTTFVREALVLPVVERLRGRSYTADEQDLQSDRTPD